ncbi:MAG: GAF domain-containing protein [Anaerolineales bacterium]|nr:GAF domain-containing protein [Anaerolineales bacterium]
MALALQNAILFASRQRRINELTTLSELAQIIANAESERDLISRTTQLVGDSLYTHNFGFLLFDENLAQLTLHDSYQMSVSTNVPHHLPLEGTVTGYVAKTGRSLRIDDTESSNVYFMGDPATRSEICVPIHIGQELIGVLNAESPLAGGFTDEDERILNTLADQLGTGLQRLRLLENERINQATTERIRQASLSLTHNLDTQVLLQQILSELQKVVAFDSGSIVTHGPDYAEIVAISGQPTAIIGSRFPKNSAQVEEMARTGQPVYIPDILAEDQFESWSTEVHFRSWVGVPLYSRRELIGHLTVDCARIDAFSPTQIQQIEAFASHAAIALENARYYAAEQHARYIESTIREAIQAFTQVLDSDTIFELLLAYLERLIPYRTANVMLLADDEHIELKSLRGYDETTEKRLREQVFLSVATHPAISRLLINGESLLLPDVRDVPYWQTHEATKYIRCWLGIPLVSQGVVLGCFQLDYDEAGFFTEEHRLIAEALAGPAAAALRNVYLLETAQHSRIQLQTSQSITALLNSQSEVFDLLPAVLKQLEEIAGASRITYLSRQGQMLRQIVTTKSIDSGILDAPFPLEDLGQLADSFKGKDQFVKDLGNLPPAPILSMLIDNGIHAVLTIPIQLGQEVVSVVAFGWEDASGYDSRQRPFFRQVASALGLAVARSRLHLETRRQANEQALLNEITREFAHHLDPVQYYVSIVHALRKHLGYDYVGLLEFDHDLETLVLKAHSGLYSSLQDKREHNPQVLEKLHLQALQRQAPQLIGDVVHHPDLASLSKLKIRSALVMPIQAGSEPFGVLSLLAPQVEAFSTSDITLLNAIIDQLSMALDKVFLFEQTQQRTDELSAITDFSSAMRNASTSDDILDLLIEQILTKLNVDLLAILQAPAGPRQHPLIWRSRRNPIAGDCVVGGNDSQIINRVFATGEYCLAPHLPTDELFIPAARDESDGLPRLHTAVYFPLKTTSRSLGLIRLGWIRQHPISSTDIRLLTAFVEIASTAMERALVLTTLEDRVIERTRQLEEANERLQDLDRLKSKFVSDVTHELRTPITNMGLYMELLATGRPEKRAKYTDVLSRQIERLGTLVQDILSLSRLDMGKIDTGTFRDFSLNKIVEQAAAPATARATEAGLQIEFELGATLPTAYGEPNQMAQVVNNLLDNAVMYTREGTILVRTWSEMPDGHPLLFLSVTDNGAGIPEDELPLIFDRFYRGTNAGQTAIPGSGLGLAIVKEIVDLHKGMVTVSNNPVRGCTFTVCFPATPDLPIAA